MLLFKKDNKVIRILKQTIRIVSVFIILLFCSSFFGSESLGAPEEPQPTELPHRVAPSFEGSLTGYWDFNAPARFVVYDSANSGEVNDGLLAGEPLWTPQGAVNGAYEWDGLDDYIDLGNSSFGIENTGGAAVSFWIKPQRFNGGNFNYIISGGAFPFYLVLRPDMGLSFRIGRSSGCAVESESLLTPGKWYFVALSFSQGEQLLYINGIPEARSRCSENILSHSTEGNLLLGRNSLLPGEPAFFQGCLDEFRIYNRSLSSQEAAEFFKSNRPYEFPPVPEESLVNYWPFDSVLKSGENAVLHNGPEFVSFGVGDSSLRLDGYDDFVDLGDGSFELGQSNAFTIALWLHPENLDLKRWNVIMQRGKFVYPFSLDMTAVGKFRFGVRTDDVHYLPSNGTLALNQWNHVAVSYRDGEQRIYLNGRPDSFQSTFGELYLPRGDINTFLGKSPGFEFDYGYFRGEMDEIYFFNEALTPEEIYSLYSFRSAVGAVSGRIAVEAGGQRAYMADITVLATTLQGEILERTQSGVDGFYQFSGLNAGKVLIQAVPQVKGFDSAFYGGSGSFHDAVPVTVISGQERAGINICLEEGGYIEGSIYSGTVLSASRGLIVTARERESGEVYSFTGISGYPYPGNYKFYLPFGRYRISVLSMDDLYREPDSLDITLSPEERYSYNSSIYLEKQQQACLSGRILSSEGFPLEGILIRARSDDGRSFSAVSHSSGTYSFSIPPGEYSLAVLPMEKTYAPVVGGPETFFSLEAGEQVTGIDFSLTEGGILRGEVFDARTGKNISGPLFVQARDPFSGEVTGMSEFSGGVFSLNVPYGEYKLELSDPSGFYEGVFWGGEKFMELSDSVFISHQEDLVEGLAFSLAPPEKPVTGVLRGKIRCADGSPLPRETNLHLVPLYTKSFQQESSNRKFWLDYGTGEFEMEVPEGYYRLNVSAGNKFKIRIEGGSETSASGDMYFAINQEARGYESLCIYLIENDDRQGTVTGRLLFPGGLDGGRYRVGLYKGSISEENFVAGAEGVLTFPDQEYCITDVPEGLFFLYGTIETFSGNGAYRKRFQSQLYKGFFGSTGECPPSENVDTASGGWFDIRFYPSKETLLPMGELFCGSSSECSISGTVSSDEGILLSGIPVHLVGIGTQSFDLVTGKKGEYIFRNIPSASGYELHFNASSSLNEAPEPAVYYLDSLTDEGLRIDHKVRKNSGAMLAAEIAFEDASGEIHDLVQCREFSVKLGVSGDSSLFTARVEAADKNGVTFSSLSGGEYFLQIDFRMDDGSRHRNISPVFNVEPGKSFYYSYLIPYNSPASGLKRGKVDGEASLYVINSWSRKEESSVIRINTDGSADAVGRGFTGLSGMTYDRYRQVLYLCSDEGILKIDSNGSLSIIAGQIKNPKKLFVTSSGQLLVASAQGMLFVLDPDNGFQILLAEGFPQILGISEWRDKFFIADALGNIYGIPKVNRRASAPENYRLLPEPVCDIAGEGFTGDPYGNLYITNNRGQIFKITPGLKRVELFFELPGFSSGALLADGRSLYVCGKESNEILSIDLKDRTPRLVYSNRWGQDLLSGPSVVCWVDYRFPEFRMPEAPSLPFAAITPDKLISRESQIPVSGFIGETGCRVFVNGLEAKVLGTAFSLDYTLSPGNNILEPVVIDPKGNLVAGPAVHMVLDKEPPRVELVINSDMKTAEDRKVRLFLEGSDGAGSGIDKIMISNHWDFRDAGWEEYFSPRDWELTEGDEKKQVFIKVLDRAGNESRRAFDSIELDEARLVLAGYVVNENDNEPVFNAKISTYPEGRVTYSDASGYFELDGLYPYVYELTIEHTSYRQMEYFSFEAGTGEAVVLAMLPVGESIYSYNSSRITGYVENEWGRRLSERAIRLRAVNPFGEEYSAGVITDGEGHYSFQGFPEYIRFEDSYVSLEIQTLSREENINAALFVPESWENEIRKDWTVYSTNTQTLVELEIRDSNDRIPEALFSGDLRRKGAASFIHLFDSATNLEPHAFDAETGVLTLAALGGNAYYTLEFGGVLYEPVVKDLFVRRGATNRYKVTLPVMESAAMEIFTPGDPMPVSLASYSGSRNRNDDILQTDTLVISPEEEYFPWESFQGNDSAHLLASVFTGEKMVHSGASVPLPPYEIKEYNWSDGAGMNRGILPDKGLWTHSGSYEDFDFTIPVDGFYDFSLCLNYSGQEGFSEDLEVFIDPGTSEEKRIYIIDTNKVSGFTVCHASFNFDAGTHRIRFRGPNEDSSVYIPWYLFEKSEPRERDTFLLVERQNTISIIKDELIVPLPSGLDKLFYPSISGSL